MEVKNSKITRLFSDMDPSKLLNEDISLEAGYYIHKKSLGEGGFGKVRLATHLKTNQKVAVKMMNKAKLGQELERVRIEVEALKILQHDSIAKMLQVIETDTDIYLILEYCSGGELFDYLISKRRLTESEVRIIMKDLFNVLTFIHSHGFAHRDLKPENILFDENHRIKLIDFGLAANSSKNKAALAFLQTCCGSPAYAAPELIKGHTYSGPSVDVWSSGVLLYSLLVGQLPFDDNNINNLYKKIQIGNFLLPRWLSEDARNLISSMLKVNPAERISVSKALRHNWITKGLVDTPSTGVNQPESSNDIDSDAFNCCKILFPNINEQDLRVRLKQFGYITATYISLKNNPEAIKNVRITHQSKIVPSQPQKSSATPSNTLKYQNVLQERRIDSIKRKLQLDCDSDQTIKRECLTPSTPNTPKFPVTGPKLDGITRTAQVTPKCPTIVAQRKQMFSNDANSGHKTTPYPVPKVPPRMTGKTARNIVSPKMRKTPQVNDENTNLPSVEMTPPKNKNVANIKSPLQPSLSPNVKATVTNTTPTKAKMIPVVNSEAKTPCKRQNLIRRLMASATPAKSHSPRKLDAKTPSNNITMTSFSNPEECIHRLTRVLRAKGVECKQKDFRLKCSYTDKIHSPLKFELEICRFNGLCVIHRKRLKGDAWNYKKICELILKLSNEEQLAALKNNANNENLVHNQATESTV